MNSAQATSGEFLLHLFPVPYSPWSLRTRIFSQSEGAIPACLVTVFLCIAKLPSLALGDRFLFFFFFHCSPSRVARLRFVRSSDETCPGFCTLRPPVTAIGHALPLCMRPKQSPPFQRCLDAHRTCLLGFDGPFFRSLLSFSLIVFRFFLSRILSSSNR